MWYSIYKIPSHTPQHTVYHRSTLYTFLLWLPYHTITTLTCFTSTLCMTLWQQQNHSSFPCSVHQYFMFPTAWLTWSCISIHEKRKNTTCRMCCCSSQSSRIIIVSVLLVIIETKQSIDDFLNIYRKQNFRLPLCNRRLWLITTHFTFIFIYPLLRSANKSTLNFVYF